MGESATPPLHVTRCASLHPARRLARFMAPGTSRLLGKEAVGYFCPGKKRTRPEQSDSPEEVGELRAERDELLQMRSEPASIKAELKFRKLLNALKAYNPDQPRVPAGNPDGGQWTIDGVSDNESLQGPFLSVEDSDWQIAGTGHHYVPRGVFESEKYSFKEDALKVLEAAKTGPLRDPTSNQFDRAHRQYNIAVEEALDSYLQRNGIRSDQMNPDQARSLSMKSRPLESREFATSI